MMYSYDSPYLAFAIMVFVSLSTIARSSLSFLRRSAAAISVATLDSKNLRQQQLISLE